MLLARLVFMTLKLYQAVGEITLLSVWCLEDRATGCDGQQFVQCPSLSTTALNVSGLQPMIESDLLMSLFSLFMPLALMLLPPTD